MPVQRLTAVLGAADRNLGPAFVEFVKPRAVHIHITPVPAEIVVVGYYVGNLDIGAFHGAGGNCRNGGEPGLIQLMAQVV